MSRAGYALRTLVAPWLTLVAIGIYVGALLQRGAPWRGETMWTLEWLGIALFALGPLVAGACAIDAARLARPLAAYLVVPTRRPRMSFARAALWAVVPLLVLHTVVYLVAVVVGESPTLTVLRPDMLLGLAVQCAVICWYAAFGSLVGRFTPPILSGIAAVVLALLAFYLLSNSGAGAPRFGLLDVGGATVTQLGRRYALTFLGVQLLILLGTAAAAFFVRLRYRRGRVLPSRAGAVLLVALLVVVVSGQVLGPQARKSLAAPVAPERCYDLEPTICLYDYHGRHADEVASRVDALVDAASAAGYDALVPTRIEQESYNYVPSDPEVWSFFLDPSDMVSDTWSQEAVIQGLLIPRCEALSSPEGPPEGYFEDLTRLMGTWSVLAGLPDVTGQYEHPEDVLPPGEVADILDRWSRCELGSEGSR